ncbi:MAG: sodium:calcium antiporter [Sandaracinaceae bacterium]
MALPVVILLFVVGSALTWQGSLVLEASAGRLCRRHGVPPLIEGTLVLAAASSFPELTATVAAAALHDAAELGIATIVGSAIFNVLVIPAAAALARKDLRYDVVLVYRDGQFYVATVAVMLLTFCFAAIYEPVEGAALTGTMTRGLALVPLAFYGIYLFLQQQDLRSDEPVERPAVEGSSLRDGLLLVGSLLAVLGGVEALLRVALWMGEALSTPSALWGGTVIAAVTSIPDLVVSVRAARRGDGEVAVGNVLGSNVFDLLVAVPLGALVAGAMVIDLAVVTPLMGALTLATLALFVMLRTGPKLSRPESGVLLALYVAFVVWLALEGAGVVSTMG